MRTIVMKGLMRHDSVFCILLTTMFILIIACESVSGDEDYYEMEVTLYQDGTEHTYIKTTDPDSCAGEGTFWASGDAYNKEEYTIGEYTIFEYNLNDIDLYEQGLPTSLHSDSDGYPTLWIYQDYFTTITVDIYTLDLPRDAVHLSSYPYPDSINSGALVLTWYNISGQQTTFTSEEYDAIVQDDDDYFFFGDEFYVFLFFFYILPILIGIILGCIGYYYDKPNWTVGVTVILPFFLSWFGLLGAFSLLSKSKPGEDVVPSPLGSCPKCRSVLEPTASFCHSCGMNIKVATVANYPPQPQYYSPLQQRPPPQQSPPLQQAKESMVSDGVQEPVVRLHRLKEIKDLGLISDEDYELKKKEILKDL